MKTTAAGGAAAIAHDVCTLGAPPSTFMSAALTAAPFHRSNSRNEATAQTSIGYAVRIGTAMSCGGTLHSAFNKERSLKSRAFTHTHSSKTHGTESAAAQANQSATSSQKAPTLSDIPRSKLLRTPRTRDGKHNLPEQGKRQHL